MGKLTSSLVKAEKNSSICKKNDIPCQFRKFFESIIDDLSVHHSTTCEFEGVKYDPNEVPYIRGKCEEKGIPKECMSFTQSAINSLCYDECEKKGLRIKDGVCYRKDVICRCMPI